MGLPFEHPREPLKQARAPRQSGFTMVELLVGVTLGLILVGVASAVFVASRHSFLVQDNMAQMQEGARAMLEDITREIRKTGSFGCYRWKDDNTPMFITATLPTGSGGSFPIPPIDQSTAVLGGPVSSLALPSASGVTPVSGTDFITVMYGQPVATLDLGGYRQQASFGAPYTLNRKIWVSSGQPMVIADCSSATVFRVDNTGETLSLTHTIGGGNNVMPAQIAGNHPLLSGNPYKSGSIVMWLEMPSFFVGTDVNGVRSLYRWDSSNGGGIQPMVANVEQMRVVYGVDAAGAPGYLNVATAWMDGAAVASGGHWGRVVSVSVHLVLRSSDQGGFGVEPKDFTWDGTNLQFIPSTSVSDKYIRQVHVINAALRTRVPIM